MRLVVVSDTHMPRMAKQLPEPLRQHLLTADAILHAGDWTQLSVYAELSRFAPVEGVAGNNDGPEIAERFGFHKVLVYGGRRIGLVHGHADGKRTDTETRALQAFAGEDVDTIIFGHSHVPLMHKRNGVLMFNPGSPTDKRRQARFSFGIIDINDDGIKGRHIFYENKL